MRDELQKELMMALMQEGIDTEKIRSKLIIILSNYEVQKRCTEVAVVDENEIEKYMRLFLINKRVAGRTDRTLKHYQTTLKRFFEDIQKNPMEITSDDIKMYLAVKEVRDNAGKVYMRNILRVVSSFYQWMQREEYLLKNPINKVDEIKVPKVKKEAFSEIQIEKMRACIGDDVKLMCIFELLLSTWCRVSELVGMKINDFSEDLTSVTVHGKGSKDRLCYINARAKIYLEKYLSERNDKNEYIFPKSSTTTGGGEDGRISQKCKEHGVKLRDWWKVEKLVHETDHTDKSNVENWVRKLGKRSGVENVHPHRFRRTGATFALRKGMPIEQVSKLLGHESIETTQIYLDISEKELEQAHRKFV